MSGAVYSQNKNSVQLEEIMTEIAYITIIQLNVINNVEILKIKLVIFKE